MRNELDRLEQQLAQSTAENRTLQESVLKERNNQKEVRIKLKEMDVVVQKQQALIQQQQQQISDQHALQVELSVCRNRFIKKPQCERQF